MLCWLCHAALSNLYHGMCCFMLCYVLWCMQSQTVCDQAEDQNDLSHKLCACCAGRSNDCVQMCTRLMAEVQPQGCSGLYACLLHQQAQADLQRQQYNEALHCLNEALAWEPQHADCLRTKALVCASWGPAQQCSQATASFRTCIIRPAYWARN